MSGKESLRMDGGMEVAGFVRAEGTKLVNGRGQELLLRGVGFGSWLLPEGYMWRFPDAGDRPRRIERAIRSWIGPEKAERFWEAYYDDYISEADIEAVAAEGFNSVRIPINARFLIDSAEPLRLREDRLRLLDRLIRWCENYAIYVVLDLHGAPGGQTGTNIDDSERDLPELFTDERNRRLTVELWRILAERYRDEWIVAGYDLLNEPLPNWFAQYNDLVMPLYKDIVRAIREVDDRHMIILEGVHWATDWSIFDERIDDNLMLQFHKYWNNPDTESIRPFLAKREAWNVPIFMGEGGENNCDWYAGAFRLFEDHGISWNFWTWKKMDCGNSPYSVVRPEGWGRLVRHLEGGPAPDPADAERTLWEYLGNLSLERCERRPEVGNALFRRAPVRIPAVFYDYSGEGASFGVRAAGGAGFREGDGADIRFAEGARDRPHFQHMRGEAWQPDEWMYVRLEEGEWAAYTFTVPPAHSARKHVLSVRLRAEGDAACDIELNDGTPLGTISEEAGEWRTLSLSQSFLPGFGEHRVRVRTTKGAVGLLWLGLAFAET